MGLERKATLIVAWLLIASPAAATDLSVFGFTFGQPLGLSECAKQDRGAYQTYDANPTTPCAIPQRNFDSGDWRTVTVIFPDAERPALVAREMMAHVRSGNLEFVTFKTRGYDVSQRTLDALKKKYGPPKKLAPTSLQNLMGARIQSFSAFWEFPDLKVLYHAVEGSLDVGVVHIGTPAGAAHEGQRISSTRKDPRPL